jgi:drug/metabolite transporter (DMT)-like permease
MFFHRIRFIFLGVLVVFSPKLTKRQQSTVLQLLLAIASGALSATVIPPARCDTYRDMPIDQFCQDILVYL